VQQAVNTSRTLFFCFPLCYDATKRTASVYKRRGVGEVSVAEKEWGIALLGAGGMARNYRNNYRAIPGTRYRLIVDVNAELAAQVAAENGAERWSTDWRETLADDIHIVDISTPNHLHTEPAVALLTAGKHVILQKPMAPTVAECREIVAASKTSGAKAGVYMSDLEDPVVWDMREIIQGGYLGSVTGIRARYAHRGGLRAVPSDGNWRGSAEKTGGGAFMQLSIHHTNLAAWLLDDTITSVMGYAKNLLCPNIGGDDLTAAVMEFDRTAVLGVFESAWNADGSCFEVYGSEGSVKMRGGQGSAVEVQLNRPYSGRVIHVSDDSRTLIPASGETHEHCRAENPLNQHVAFVTAVRDGLKVPVPAEVGLFDVAVVKAVYESAQSGRRISIEEMLS
jgi:predicted dehydrogenase